MKDFTCAASGAPAAADPEEAEPEMPVAPEVMLAGMRAVLDSSGALWWPDEATLIVSDLHLEHGSSFARRRVFLPPYDTGETLARLAAVIAAHAPARVIALGDSFHDRHAPMRMHPADAALLAGLVAGREWVWITGNHDETSASAFGGTVTAEFTLAGVTFRHVPAEALGGREVAGHLHPAARISRRGRSLRRRCFVGSAKRLIMPAFGAFTGGLNVRDPAFAPLWPEDAAVGVFMLGRRGVYPVSGRELLPG